MKKNKSLLKLTFLKLMAKINNLHKLLSIEKLKKMYKLYHKLIFKDSHNAKGIIGNKKAKDNIKINKKKNLDKKNRLNIMQMHKSKDKINKIIIRNKSKVFKLNKI
jgi:hypothetical protein